MRVGRFRLRQRWIDREVSRSLTGAVMVLIWVAGFVLGFGVATLGGQGGCELAMGMGRDGSYPLSLSRSSGVDVTGYGQVLGCSCRGVDVGCQGGINASLGGIGLVG